MSRSAGSEAWYRGGPSRARDRDLAPGGGRAVRTRSTGLAGPGRLAQRESASLTRRRPLVRSQCRPRPDRRCDPAAGSAAICAKTGLLSRLRALPVPDPRSSTDRAAAYGAVRCRFESCRGCSGRLAQWQSGWSTPSAVRRFESFIAHQDGSGKRGDPQLQAVLVPMLAHGSAAVLIHGGRSQSGRGAGL